MASMRCREIDDDASHLFRSVAMTIGTPGAKPLLDPTSVKIPLYRRSYR